MSMNFLKIDSYVNTMAAAATPESVVDNSGSPTKWRYALDVIITCPSTNTSDLKVGNATRQLFTIPKGTSLRMTTMMNRMSQSARYDLNSLFVKVGTSSDKAEILLVEPSNDDPNQG